MAAPTLAVLIGCLVLVGITSAQTPADNRVRTRTGPPLTEPGEDPNILSVGAWWVRVNAHGTDTGSIRWRLGKTVAELTPTVPELNHYLHWQARPPLPGSPELGHRHRWLYPGNMTLWLWEYLKPEQIIYLWAWARRATDTASFCVFYQ